MLPVHGIDTLLSTSFRQVVTDKEVDFYIAKLLILVREEEKE